ncbi:MAG: multicopper oxidase domain-containing protein [Acidobacteria bacterium]|nr:multicopper oxidase domain-containing protein [Acidobacteriota bacterium]
MKSTKVFLAAVAVALMLGAGFWRLRGERTTAPKASYGIAEAVGSQHRLHQPPTKGSDLYQYRYPSERRFAAESVYDPTPPPPGLATNGVREFTLVIEEDVEHEVAPGVKVPAWTFNGTVPGPVLRATEGELLRITLVNHGKVPHTIHFHGIHPASMDGVFELVPPGASFTYEFVAQPYGVMPYHCHAMPTSQHIHNGLYGMLIIDPKQGRPPMRELAMVMSAFDLDRDGEAEFYAWNGRAFQYTDHPIELSLGQPVRMYVMNMFEEAMVPHIHGNLFHLYPSGTTLQPTEYTDVKTLSIAERAILEFQYDSPGAYMFQCHVTEHMEQGLMGWFQVLDHSETAQQRSY